MEFDRDEIVLDKPPNQTNEWAKPLPHMHVVRAGEILSSSALWIPLGVGLVEEKVNLHPLKLPVDKGSITADGLRSEISHLMMGDKTYNLSKIN